MDKQRRFCWEFQGNETTIDGNYYKFEFKAITGRYVYVAKGGVNV